MKTKYSTYKESGIEWVGEIPGHWTKNKFNREVFFQEGPGLRNWQFTDEGIKVICVTNITNRGIDFSNYKKYISKEEYENSYAHFKVEKGNLLLSSSGNSWGKIAEFKGDEDVILNTSTIRLQAKKGSNDFVKYLMKSEYVQEQLGLMMTGACQPNFGPTHLNKLEVFVPPLHEQKAIAQYLDQKTALIDDLIDKTIRKIALLREQRTAIINQAVTKGLDPDVPMKDSGIEWIGEIPEHWSHSKLGFYSTKIGAGSTPRGGAEVYVESGIPFIRSQNVHFGGLRLENVSYITEEVHSSMKNTTVYRDDLLLNITGGSIGRCCLVNTNGEMNVNQHVSIIRTTDGLLNTFLFFVLSSDLGQSQVVYNISGGNREGLTIEGIEDFRITLPPILEQLAIVDFLDQKTCELDNLIRSEEKAIELLKEYKQALISEVVTGKVCVLDEVPISTKTLAS